MFALSRATLAERWSLFVGAVLSVALGVALVQSSLLLLLTAATSRAPSGASAIEVTAHAASTTVSITVLAVTLAFAAFLAFFIIGTTFAFTIDQRGRDIALLRLVGASRRQVKRLLLSEAASLGLLGAIVGVPLGVVVVSVHAALLAHLGLVPAGFTAHWQPWVPGASAATGIALAVGGALIATRRAAAIAPLSALRDGDESAPVMTRARWIVAALFGAGAVALLVLAPVGGAAGGQAMAMNVSIAAAIALTAAAPLLVPLAARLIPSGRSAVLPLLARASLRDNVRRSASTAAPLVILVGILVGQPIALLSFASAGAAEASSSTTADLVVESTEGTDPALSEAAGIAGAPGVAGVSTEVTVPAAVTTGEGDFAFTELGTVTIIDPASFVLVHSRSEALAELSTGTAAAGPGSIGLGTGARVSVGVGEARLEDLEVVAVTEASMASAPTLYLPSGALSAEVTRGASTVSFVTVDDGADPGDVAASLERFGTVTPAERWFEESGSAASGSAASILVVVLGLGALYAIIGVVNSIVIAGATRGREFAVARVSGLTRRQVIRGALLESTVVTGIALALGFAAAAGTAIAVLIVTASVTGTAMLTVPWTLVAAVILGALALTATTSLLSSWSATRPAPVTLVRGRE